MALLAASAAPLGAVPDVAQDDLDRARIALARGDGIAAEADLRRAQGAGAAPREISVDMGEALIQQGERRKAREWLQGGEFPRGEEARGWRLLAMLERLDGNLPAAGQALDRALATGARDPLLWVEIGRLRYQGGEHLLAVQAADRALAEGPEDPRALEFKAQLLRDSGGDAAAIVLLQRALTIAPDDLLLL
ncbi:MAG: tetratricopeptide repeat protein, partial [Sphingomonadaceae bacterium]|nr:tetratricopeptide repeat protein [Sphingomonadaceae bacterium]